MRRYAAMTDVSAAMAVALRHGVPARAPVVLRDAGLSLIWLAPAPVVAKVAALPRQPLAAAVLLREVRVVQHLAGAGAPVVPPSDVLPQRVHLEDQYALTFWRYEGQVATSRDVDTAEAARTLGDVHAALAGCPIDLASFRERQLEPARRALASAGAAALVPASELPLLRRVHTALTDELSRRALFEVPVHGDPHPGTLLATPRGYLWTGFEVACRAPVEWDLTAIPGGGDGVFAGVDADLLRVLRVARSLVRVLWCWRHMPPSPRRDEVVRPHLTHLHEYA